MSANQRHSNSAGAVGTDGYRRFGDSAQLKLRGYWRCSWAWGSFGSRTKVSHAEAMLRTRDRTASVRLCRTHSRGRLCSTLRVASTNGRAARWRCAWVWGFMRESGRLTGGDACATRLATPSVKSVKSVASNSARATIADRGRIRRCPRATSGPAYSVAAGVPRAHGRESRGLRRRTR